MKKLELLRYNERGKKKLKEFKNQRRLELDKYRNLPSISKIQYKCYKKLIKETVKKEMKVLEIGCGTGEFSWQAISSGAQVTLTDISNISLEAAKFRFKNKLNKIDYKLADMEDLPFDEESFDVVLSSGSLSYGDHKIVRNEIYRVLKYDGYFICIDSLDHNLIYKLNRFIHFIKRERTWDTISRIPNLKLIKSYEKFGWCKHYYFGSFIWFVNIFKEILTEDKIIKLSLFLDKLFANHLTAFNFVMIAKKINLNNKFRNK